jgi:anti-anti-sigma regulatory factor
MQNRRRFDVALSGDVTILRLKDPHLSELLEITELHDEMLEYIEQQSPHNLLVDFATVTHCSTAVINALLRAKKRLLKSGGRFMLCSMHDKVREAYRVLNLDGTVFEIYDSLPEALDAFA